MPLRPSFFVCLCLSMTVRLSVCVSLLVLLLQLGSLARFPMLALHLNLAPKEVLPPACLRIMKTRSASGLRLICFAVAGMGASLNRFLEGAPSKFLNE